MANPINEWRDTGHYGQYVMIVPSMELVIVRLGQTYNTKVFDVDEFIVEVLNNLKFPILNEEF